MCVYIYTYVYIYTLHVNIVMEDIKQHINFKALNSLQRLQGSEWPTTTSERQQFQGLNSQHRQQGSFQWRE